MTRTMVIGLLGLATACGNADSGTSSGGGGAGGLDACARATVHETECLALGTGGAGGAPCTGARACRADCINAHACAQIAGNDPGYLACVEECQGK